MDWNKRYYLSMWHITDYIWNSMKENNKGTTCNEIGGYFNINVNEGATRLLRLHSWGILRRQKKDKRWEYFVADNWITTFNKKNANSVFQWLSEDALEHLKERAGNNNKIFFPYF